MKELIVTQWDVNDGMSVTNGSATRINSYIVGCKYTFLLALYRIRCELIVTQWDVNVYVLI